MTISLLRCSIRSPCPAASSRMRAPKERDVTSASVGLVKIALALACAAAASAASAMLPIQQWRTASGAQVLFVETHDLPMFDLAADFPAGASRDMPDKSGAASLTLGLMRSGAGTFGEDEI